MLLLRCQRDASAFFFCCRYARYAPMFARRWRARDKQRAKRPERRYSSVNVKDAASRHFSSALASPLPLHTREKCCLFYCRWRFSHAAPLRFFATMPPALAVFSHYSVSSLVSFARLAAPIAQPLLVMLPRSDTAHAVRVDGGYYADCFRDAMNTLDIEDVTPASQALLRRALRRHFC